LDGRKKREYRIPSEVKGGEKGLKNQEEARMARNARTRLRGRDREKKKEKDLITCP